MKKRKTEDIVYITGHRHPDLDSVASAIAYTELKKAQGISAVACRLGDLNAESEWLIKDLKLSTPMLLKDARATLEEIEMDPPIRVAANTTIYEALEIMHNEGKKSLAVVNDHDQLLGVVTSSNLSIVALGDTAIAISLLQKTSVENITRTIKGRLLYTPDQTRFNGKVSIIAIATTKLENYELENRLVIVGNDTDAQLAAIEKKAAVLVVVWASAVAPNVLEAAKASGCAVLISGHGTLNTSRYLYFSPEIREIMTVNPVSFNKSEYVDEVGKAMLKTRFRSYPVVDDQNRIYGFIGRYHILTATNRKVIMVDHNEFAQSVLHIESADIQEVIDHHRISDMSTAKPIVFRNEIIGSTASIITKMYHEAGIPIRKAIAKLLLAAILSDTLAFRSPTTTPQDKVLADELAALCGVEVDAFAKELFSVASAIANKTPLELIAQDIKAFTIDGHLVHVSQITVAQFDEAVGLLSEFKPVMEAYVEDKKVELLVVAFTSVLENGSIFLSAGALRKAVCEAFPDREHEAYTIHADIVSRKNQIIPRLSTAIAEL